MPEFLHSVKKAVVGAPLGTAELRRERLPKRFAVPAYSSDSLSSLAYAPDDILATLAIAGLGASMLSPWIGVVVAVVMLIVVLAHRNLILQFPGGGGDFAVASRHLGSIPSRIVGASLLVDYVLAVAVATSQAAAYVSGAWDFLDEHRVELACLLVAVLAVAHLRGSRQSARVVAGPVVVFALVVAIVLVVGAVQASLGILGNAPTAATTKAASSPGNDPVMSLGLALLVARAVASGCVSASGMRAFAHGMESFRPPKPVNASLGLAMTGAVTGVFLLGVVWLASTTHVAVAAASDVHSLSQARIPVLSQITQAVFGERSAAFYAMSVLTALVLCIAAYAAFTGFSHFAATLAKKSFLPRHFATRGDRLAYSNGLLTLAVLAGLVVILTGANVRVLIYLYVVGVFISFLVGQVGLYRHFGQRLRVAFRVEERRWLLRKKRESATYASLLAIVFVGIAVTKVPSGAWMSLLAMAVLVVAMGATHNYYANFAQSVELRAGQGHVPHRDPASGLDGRLRRSHAVVLVTQANRPALAALCEAQAVGHVSLQAVAVHTDDRVIDELQYVWSARKIPIPLRIIYSPYREFMTPIVDYVRSLTRIHPRDRVVVYIPEFIVGHWWQTPLHNSVLRRLRHRLARDERIDIRTVPWNVDIGVRAMTRRRAERGPGENPR